MMQNKIRQYGGRRGPDHLTRFGCTPRSATKDRESMRRLIEGRMGARGFPGSSHGEGSVSVRRRNG